MNCDVIQDLIPLYADECCSEASKNLVEAHLKACPKCRKIAAPSEKLPDLPVTPTPPRLHIWEASFLQVGLYYVTFALLVLGVLKEGNTPHGPENGIWAFALIIPTTGFLLSLVNLYCIRIYPSRRAFVIGSFLLTLCLSSICYLWGYFHYEKIVLFPSVLLSIAFCAASPFLSNLYARLVGKQ